MTENFVASSYNELLDRLSKAVQLLKGQGPTTNTSKPMLISTKETAYLDFWPKTKDMTIQITEKNK